MQAQWQQLEERDKKLILMLAVTLIIAGVYWFVWQPLQEQIANTSRQIKVQENTLADVKVIGQKIVALQGNARAASGGDLNQLVNRSAQRNKIKISRMQAKADSLQLWVDNIAFDRFLDWLEELEFQHGIKVENLDISTGDNSGMIKVRRLQLGKAS